MKKNFKKLLSVTLIGLSLGLASCGSVSQKYADKVNAAVKTESEKDDYTYDQVKKDLGDPASSLVINGSGAAVWKDKKGNTVTVTFAGGKAIGAAYTEAKQD